MGGDEVGKSDHSVLPPRDSSGRPVTLRIPAQCLYGRSPERGDAETQGPGTSQRDRSWCTSGATPSCFLSRMILFSSLLSGGTVADDSAGCPTHVIRPPTVRIPVGDGWSPERFRVVPNPPLAPTTVGRLSNVYNK